jgi:hypothetical protein
MNYRSIIALETLAVRLYIGEIDVWYGMNLLYTLCSSEQGVNDVVYLFVFL